MPTESFFPKMKYDKQKKLPIILMIQKATGTTGFLATREAQSWTNHRAENISTPTYPIIFHPVMWSPQNWIKVLCILVPFLCCPTVWLRQAEQKTQA